MREKPVSEPSYFCTVIHLCAPNDRNGNPRRVYVVFDGDEAVASYDEGYRGWGALPAHLRDKPTPRISVPPSEYRAWVKFGEAMERGLHG